MKILDFGSLNIDHVYNVDHFVKPGETLAANSFQNFCGGKGLNQSIAAAKAGGKVYHAGKIGADGEVLKNRLEEYGIDTAYLLRDASVATGHAIIEVDPSGQNRIIIFGGANFAITKSEVDAILCNFDQGDILMLQNEVSLRDYILEKAHERGMIIYANPSPLDEGLKNSPALQYINCFVLNEVEGYELTRETKPDKILDALLKRFPGCSVMLTLGKNGAVFTDGTRKASHGIYNVKVVDTTAAGDTFMGYFVACSAEKLPIEKTLELASKASSLSVSKAGASDSIPTRAEVETANLSPAK